MRLPPVVVLLQPDEAGQATGQQGREHDDASEQAKVMAVARQQEGHQCPATTKDGTQQPQAEEHHGARYAR